jgi:rhodanese-related sulfurtransferase
MNKTLIREAAFILIAAILLGFGYTYVTKKGFFLPKSSTPDIQMCSLDEAKSFFDSRSALFVDSRHAFDFKRGHIQGAVNVALNEFDQHQDRLANIPRDRLLVIYCDGAECNSSIELAIKLSALGFTSTKVLFGGWQEWKTKSFPIGE